MSSQVDVSVQGKEQAEHRIGQPRWARVPSTEQPAGTVSASIPSAPSPWMRCRRPTADIPARPWRWLRWHSCCGIAICGTIPAIRTGRDAIASSSPMVTPACCCMPCSTSPATICRSTTSSSFGSGSRKLPAILSTTTCPAWKSRLVRWVRASRIPSAWRSRSAGWQRSSTRTATIFSTTAFTPSAAMAT